MSDTPSLRTLLLDLANVLDSGHEESQAANVRNALCGPEEIFEEFLVSNELWGGSGSIADQALVDDKGSRKRLEDLLVRIGRLQVEAGRINARTKMWIEAFERWSQLGLR